MYDSGWISMLWCWNGTCLFMTLSELWTKGPGALAVIWDKDTDLSLTIFSFRQSSSLIFWAQIYSQRQHIHLDIFRQHRRLVAVSLIAYSHLWYSNATSSYFSFSDDGWSLIFLLLPPSITQFFEERYLRICKYCVLCSGYYIVQERLIKGILSVTLGNMSVLFTWLLADGTLSLYSSSR